MTTHKEGSGGLGIGLGIAALAAMAAGAYFLYGKDGEKNQRKVKGWMLKMRGEVLEKMEDLKDMTQDGYEKVIDEVKAHYEGVKNIDASELTDLSDELKAHWKNIQKQIEPVYKKAKTKKG